MLKFLRTRIGVFTFMSVLGAIQVISAAGDLGLAHPDKVWLGLCMVMGAPMAAHWLVNLGQEVRRG